jgi:hypothetical protein
MNRIQFFVLTGLSSLVVLLLIGQIFLARQAGYEQNRLQAAQQVITQGQAFQSNLKQLAVRIFQDSQKTQDQGLKDLLTRQQISYTPNAETNSTENPMAPTPAPATH